MGKEQNWDKAKSFFKKGAKVAGTFAVKTAVKKTTGQNVEFDSSEPLTVEIAEIKKEIQKNINMIINDDKNPLKKIVFFVDDLDRIDPPVAVEVLEALKNIFDLDNCVFILAIDYDVVIKGLEKKFGEKTDKNEREFRSFFDKIIQVPFSMPTGAYEIDNLLESKLNDLGLSLDEDLKEDYVRILQMTVGYIPRSIKRYVNSFSLLKKIRSMEPAENHDKLADFCLFTLLGIQISYPKIYRLIAKKQSFTKWNGFFGKQIGVDEIIIPGEKHEYTDEEWEQVLWSYCQKDSYLKARALSIIGALNLLREKLGEHLTEIMEQSMEFASMTSVDDDVETKQAGRGRRDTNRYIVTDPDGVEHIVDNLGKFVEDVNKEKGKNFIWAGNLRKVAQGKTKRDNSKGYKCTYADGNVKIAA